MRKGCGQVAGRRTCLVTSGLAPAKPLCLLTHMRAGALCHSGILAPGHQPAVLCTLPVWLVDGSRYQSGTAGSSVDVSGYRQGPGGHPDHIWDWRVHPDPASGPPKMCWRSTKVLVAPSIRDCFQQFPCQAVGVQFWNLGSFTYGLATLWTTKYLRAGSSYLLSGMLSRTPWPMGVGFPCLHLAYCFLLIILSLTVKKVLTSVSVLL